MKIIHTGDWHYNDRDHDEIEKCVDSLIARAKSETPDLIAISGDITDSQNLKLDSRSARTICRQISELADIAPVVIIIGTPSHDGRAAEVLRYVRGKYQIHVSERPEQLYLQGWRLTDCPGHDEVEAVITQIPTPTKQFFQAESAIEDGDRAISQAMTAILGAFGVQAEQHRCPHILNGHFQVGGAFISDTQQLVGRDIEISTDQLAMANAHVVCLGHIHKAQAMGREKNIFYSGSIYRKNFGELDDKGFYIHTIRPAELDSFVLSSEFVLTPTRKLLVIREDTTKGDINGVLACLHMAYGPAELQDAHIKVELKVWQDEANQINQAALERSFLDSGAAWVSVTLIRVPREAVRAARILTLDSLRDKIKEMAAVRMENVSDEVLAKADLLETMNQDELLQVVGRVN